MSDEAAFLEALKANPADDTVRLVYADWLDEHNQHAKAEYLRLVVGAVGPCDLPATLRRLRELASAVEPSWPLAVTARFEVTLNEVPAAWGSAVVRMLQRQVRAPSGETFGFVQVAPSVWSEGLTAEQAAEAAETLAAEVAREIEQPQEQLGREYYLQMAEVFRSQVPGGSAAWFSVRATGSRTAPVPVRFAVCLCSREWTLATARSHQNPDPFIGPLAEAFGIDPEDARHLLYATHSVPLTPELAYTTALSQFAGQFRRLRQHGFGAAFAEFVWLKILPVREGSWADDAGDAEEPS